MNVEELNTVIPIAKFLSNPEYVKYIIKNTRFNQFPIETEFTIKTPQFCVPLMARLYYLDMWLIPGHKDTFNYQELSDFERDNFKGTGHYEGVVLKEVWEDGGDDGHIEPYLFGYIFIKASNIK
jgi:hypothetical protein